MDSQSATNMTSMSADAPSICIPRVFQNISQKRVQRVFEELDVGKIERVDMVERTNVKGEKFKRCFIHFINWATNVRAQEVRSKLLAGEEIKIIYDDPWFWKCSASRIPKPVHGGAQRGVRRPRPRIDLEGSSSVSACQWVKKSKDVSLQKEMREAADEETTKTDSAAATKTDSEATTNTDSEATTKTDSAAAAV